MTKLKLRDILKQYKEEKITTEVSINEILNVYSKSKDYNYFNHWLGMITGLTIALIFNYFNLI